MSDSEIQINVKGPSELKLQITISTAKTVLELKQAIAEKSDVEADRQRLIYSGRVLKDEDQLSVYKVQSSHTIHMVKGVSRSAASSSAQQASSTPASIPTMQAGQNPHDPLTQINGHMGFGAMAGFNPFTEMGINPNDPNMMQTMMSSPQFLQQISGAMSNPAVLDQIISSNPQLSAVAPQVREMFQSERFREMMSNPETLRTMLQMASTLRGGDPFGNPFGGGATGAGAFPAPGVPSTGTTTSTTSTDGQQQSQQPPMNPFAGLFPPPQPGATGSGGLPNMFDPAMMQQMQAALGGYGGFGGGFGAPATAPAADTRPPEERFQVQLEQLQGMGFTNAAQNVRALLATAGNVHSAIDYILGGGGL
jgi:ubiquilin